MFLLDTNVVSELKKIELNRADVNVARWNAQTNSLDYWLSVVTILELTMGVLRLERKDPKQAYRDAFIAATALRHGLIVVTRNVPDFAGTGVKLVNPWDAISA
jgi:predicted nucleic acid-binding protein